MSGIKDARVLSAFASGLQRPYMLGVEQRLTDVTDQLAPNVATLTKTSGFSTTSSSAVDVAGMALNITTTGGPLLLIATSQYFYVDHTAAASGEFGLSVNGHTTWLWQYSGSGNTYPDWYGLSAITLMPVGAGTYTIKGQAKTNGGTLYMLAGATYPIQLMAVEL